MLSCSHGINEVWEVSEQHSPPAVPRRYFPNAYTKWQSGLQLVKASSYRCCPLQKAFAAWKSAIPVPRISSRSAAFFRWIQTPQKPSVRNALAVWAQSCRAGIPPGFQQEQLARTSLREVHREGKVIHPPRPKFPSPALATPSGWLSHHIMSSRLWHRTTETTQSNWCQTDCIWHPGKIFSPCVCYPESLVPNCCNTRSEKRCEQVTRPLLPESAVWAGKFLPFTVSTLQAGTSSFSSKAGQSPLMQLLWLKLDPSFISSNPVWHETNCPQENTCCVYN